MVKADSSGRVDRAPDYLKSHRFKLQIWAILFGKVDFPTGLPHKDRGLIGQKGQEFLNRQDKIIANNLVDSLVAVDVFHIFYQSSFEI